MKEPEAVPCVGCGYCCQVATCSLGLMTFNSPRGQCPALIFEEGRFWCAIVRGAHEILKKRLIRDLAIGAGCSSSLCNTQREAALKEGLEEYLQELGSKKQLYGC